VFGLSVVETTLENDQLTSLVSVDQPMLVIDATRPTTGKRMPKRLGLSDSRERVLMDCPDQRV